MPLQDNVGQDNNGTLISPVDYTSLCVPKDYCIYGNHGNKLDKMVKEDREAVLSKRGVWPSDEAIEYQFAFVEMMKGIEAENEIEVEGNLELLPRLRDGDGGYGDESHDESSDEDDDESLTISFEVGPSKINRFPDLPSHYISNEIVVGISKSVITNHLKSYLLVKHPVFLKTVIPVLCSIQRLFPHYSSFVDNSISLYLSLFLSMCIIIYISLSPLYPIH